MHSKYIIEKSTNRRDTFEVWKHNTRKGYYNFVGYVSKEEKEDFKNTHKKDEIIEKP